LLSNLAASLGWLHLGVSLFFLFFGSWDLGLDVPAFIFERLGGVFHTTCQKYWLILLHYTILHYYCLLLPRPLISSLVALCDVGKLSSPFSSFSAIAGNSFLLVC